MLGKLASKALWGATKITVKYVIVPIAYTAALAYLMDQAAEKIRDHTPDAAHVDPEMLPAP